MLFVKVEKPVKTTHEKLGDVKVNVEVPAVESLEEFVQFAGGDANAIDYVNSAIENAAKNGVRTGGRAAPSDITMEDLIARLQSAARNYTPQSAGRGAVVKAKAAKLDSIEALVKSGKEFTKEELLAILESSK